MDYKVVKLSEKKLVGICARTSNSDKQMPEIIGGLWKDFFQKGIYNKISNKVNNRTIGLYSDYEDGVNGSYSIMVGCEVDDNNKLLEELVSKIIPSGEYAEFILYSDKKEAIADFWSELWKMPLKRRYTSDFEEYFSTTEGDFSEIHIYIAIDTQ